MMVKRSHPSFHFDVLTHSFGTLKNVRAHQTFHCCVYMILRPSHVVRETNSKRTSHTVDVFLLRIIESAKCRHTQEG